MSSALARPVEDRQRPAPNGFVQRADMVLLLGLALPAAYLDWQIARTWSWSPLATAAWLGVSLLAAAMGLRWLAQRNALAGLVVASLYGGPVIAAMVRLQVVPSPVALIGDGALLTQLAGDQVLRGKDPYGADYAALGLGRTPWAESFPNPALHHAVYFPGQFLWPLPLQAISESLLHWWDERLFLLLCGVAIWILLQLLMPGAPGRAAAFTFFLVPGHNLMAVLGDNDLTMLVLLLGALLAAQRKRFVLMGVLLGLSMATKQHALLVVPFVVFWAINRGASLSVLAKAAGAGVAGLAAVLVPFLFWNANAFIQDTIVFVIGSGPQAYPINGFGLSVILLNAGLIHGTRDAFAFAPIEAGVGIVLWAVGYLWLVRRGRLPDVLLFGGLTALLVLFVSRYFHDTHLILGTELMGAGLVARLRVWQP